MKIPKPNIFFKSDLQKRRFVFALILVLLAIAAILAWNFFKDKNVDEKRSQELIQKVDSIATPTTTCEEIIDKLGNEKADDNYNWEAKARLLSQQASCYADTGDFNKAINLAEQLKSVYENEGNSEKVQSTSTIIEGYKQLKEAYEFEKRNLKNAKPTE